MQLFLEARKWLFTYRKPIAQNCNYFCVIVIFDQDKKYFLNTRQCGSKFVLNTKDKNTLPSKGFWTREGGKACEQSDTCYDGRNTEMGL